MDLEQAFLRAINKLIGSKEAFIIDEISDCVGGIEDIDAKLEGTPAKVVEVKFVFKVGVAVREVLG